MLTRALVLAGAVTALLAAPASAQTELNVIPHGQSQPGSAFLGQPGFLPADAQARMYDRLTPLYRDVGADVLVPSADGSGYFKSARLIANPEDPELISDETVSGRAGGRTLTARIRRDAYGVPHVYSDTDDGVLFGAGHVMGQDRSLVLDQARRNGVASLIDLPGAPGIVLVLGLYDFQPSKRVIAEVTRRQERALLRAGSEGRAVLRDIDTYLAGLNTWRAANAPSTPPYTRTDVFALNGIKAQFLGEGGGAEVDNAELLARLRKQLGRRNGGRAYADLRQRNDPEHVRTTTRDADWYEGVSETGGRGSVALRAGSFRSAAVELPGTSAGAAAAAAKAADRHEASNVLLVSGGRSETGRPVFAGGPQIGYNYPGLTLEMGLYGPSIRVRGATSAPFPGYMLIGRGEDFGFTLTSAGSDIVDVYAERLCGGSRTRYRHRGRCRRMQTVAAGTISKGDDSERVSFRRTVHGPVIGYARTRGGRLVALARKRASVGRETNDQLLFRRLTFGQVRDSRQLRAAAALTPQTFNSFLATDREIAFYTSGRMPIRPRGVNPDLPVDGRGRHEWRGYLPSRRHPQAANPSSGMLVNWNNEPARGWPASDERFSQGPAARAELLTTELARRSRHTPASVLAAENAGATQDTRGKLTWPVISGVLDRAPPSELAGAIRDQLDAWAADGASWRDTDSDGRFDAAGVEIMEVVWEPLARAALCGRLGRGGCAALAARQPVAEGPPGGQSGGWQHYVDKDLRRLLGRRVRGRYALRYCGRGSARRCARDLWRAIDRASRSAASSRGEDPSAWRRATGTASIRFTPVPLFEMDYANRPSGIHQVLQFAP